MLPRTPSHIKPIMSIFTILSRRTIGKVITYIHAFHPCFSCSFSTFNNNNTAVSQTNFQDKKSDNVWFNSENFEKLTPAVQAKLTDEAFQTYIAQTCEALQLLEEASSKLLEKEKLRNGNVGLKNNISEKDKEVVSANIKRIKELRTITFAYEYHHRYNPSLTTIVDIVRKELHMANTWVVLASSRLEAAINKEGRNMSCEEVNQLYSPEARAKSSLSYAQTLPLEDETEEIALPAGLETKQQKDEVKEVQEGIEQLDKSTRRFIGNLCAPLSLLRQGFTAILNKDLDEAKKLHGQINKYLEQKKPYYDFFFNNKQAQENVNHLETLGGDDLKSIVVYFNHAYANLRDGSVELNELTNKGHKDHLKKLRECLQRGRDYIKEGGKKLMRFNRLLREFPSKGEGKEAMLALNHQITEKKKRGFNGIGATR